MSVLRFSGQECTLVAADNDDIKLQTHHRNEFVQFTISLPMIRRLGIEVDHGAAPIFGPTENRLDSIRAHRFGHF